MTDGTPPGYPSDAVRDYLSPRGISAATFAARQGTQITPEIATQLAPHFASGARVPEARAAILNAGLLAIPLFTLGEDGSAERQAVPQLRRRNDAADSLAWSVARKFRTAPRQPGVATLHPSNAAAVGDPSVPLIATEGVFKGDAILEAVGMDSYGVLTWQGVDLPTVSVGKSIGPRPGDFCVLHRQLLVGREVYLAFDGDASTKAGVARGVDRTAALLTEAGALVRIVRIPDADGKGIGIDDHLAASTDKSDALDALIADSVEWTSWRKSVRKDSPKLLSEVQPRVLPAATWGSTNDEWSPAVIGELLLRAPESLEVDGDLILTGSAKVGAAAFDEHRLPVLRSIPLAAQEHLVAEVTGTTLSVRATLAKVTGLTFEAIDDALRVLCPASKPVHFDAVFAALRGDDTGLRSLLRASGDGGVPRGQQLLEAKARDVLLAVDDQTDIVWSYDKGLLAIDERPNKRTGEWQRHERNVSAHVAFTTEIRRSASLLPNGRLRTQLGEETALVTVAISGEAVKLPNPLPLDIALTPSVIWKEAAFADGQGRITDLVDARRDASVFRVAAQALSAGARTRTVTTRLGWLETPNGMELVTPHGRIQNGGFGDDVIAEPTHESALTVVPATIWDEELPATDLGADAMQMDSELARILTELIYAGTPGDRTLGWIVLGSIVAAPFAGASSRATPFIVGLPGKGKSTVTKGFQKAVTGSTGTSGSGISLLSSSVAGARVTLSQAGPVALILDDFKPVEVGGNKQREAAADILDEITGVAYDGADAVRSAPDGKKLREPVPISVTPIVTAEDVLTNEGRSQRMIFKRMFGTEINPTAIENADPTIPPRYWRWVQRTGAKFSSVSEMKDAYEALRTEYLRSPQSQPNPRLAGNIGGIWAAMRLMGMPNLFAGNESVAGLPTATWAAEWEAVELSIIAETVTEQQATDVGQRLIDTLASMVGTGGGWHLDVEFARHRGARLHRPNGLQAEVMKAAEQYGHLGYTPEYVGADQTLALRPVGKSLGTLTPDCRAVVFGHASVEAAAAKAGLGGLSKTRLKSALESRVLEGTTAGAKVSRKLAPGQAYGFVLTLDSLGVSSPLDTVEVAANSKTTAA